MKRYAIRYVEKPFKMDRMKNVVLKGHIEDAFFRTKKERIAFINKNSMYAYQYGKVIDGDIYSVVWDKYFIIKAGKITRLAPIQFDDILLLVEAKLHGASIVKKRFRVGLGWSQESSKQNLDDFLQTKLFNNIGVSKKCEGIFGIRIKVRQEIIDAVVEAVEVMCEV